MKKISDEELEEIVVLGSMASNLNQTFISDGLYVVGADSNEHYQFAKCENLYDAAYTAKVISAGKEIAKELIELRSQRRWIPISEPPSTKDMCFLLDANATFEQQIGFSVSTGWYNTDFKKWVGRGGDSLSWTHWIYCYKVGYFPEVPGKEGK
jgi:hypothetical protein